MQQQNNLFLLQCLHIHFYLLFLCDKKFIFKTKNVILVLKLNEGTWKTKIHISITQKQQPEAKKYLKQKLNYSRVCLKDTLNSKENSLSIYFFFFVWSFFPFTQKLANPYLQVVRVQVFIMFLFLYIHSVRRKCWKF